MRKHILFIALVVLFPLVLVAQSNDVGIFVSSATYGSTHFSDPGMPGHDLEVKLESGDGVGASYSRTWTPNISTEIAAIRLKTDVKRGMSAGSGAMSAGIGDADLLILSGIVRWHLLGKSPMNPYVGAGVARVDGKFDPEGEEGASDFDGKTTWVANAGIAYRVAPRVSVGLDLKYVPCALKGSAVAPVDLNVDPLILAAGIHYLF